MSTVSCIVLLLPKTKEVGHAKHLSSSTKLPVLGPFSILTDYAYNSNFLFSTITL